MSSYSAGSTSAAATPRQAKSQHASPTPANTAPSNFHTVTCVTWSASGRNIGVGTPDGFLVYSTEPLVSTLSGASLGSTPLPQISGRAETEDGGVLQEVCRCAVYGGVGLLSLYKQCSVVAFTGVQRRSAAARVQLADISQPPPSTFFTTTTAASRAVRPWSVEENAAVAEWYEGWCASAFANASVPPSTIAATLAYAECPSTVAALHLCPHAVIAASSGDPKIAGSHTLYVLDHRLRPLYTLPVYPPSSNAYLTDMIAIAATFTASNGAGMMVQRLRVMLPGEKKGEVRLLTLKKSVLTATAYDSPASPARPFSAPAAAFNSGESHRLVDRVLHQAPLRAVAITEDGRSGVTMSNQGMRLRLVDFVGDDIISERLSLERGRLPAVTDTVSLAIVSVPQPGSHLRSAAAVVNGGGGAAEGHERCGSDSGVVVPYADLPNRQYQLLTEALHDIVVCLTSSGTMHLFGCGLQQVLFYYSDKTFLPRVGYPYAFSVCLPSQLVKESGAALFVTRSDVATSAARFLPRREHRQAQRSGKTGAWTEKVDEVAASPLPCDLFAFQLRYPVSLSARDGRDAARSSGDGPCCSLLVRCPFAT
ncbi:hypothetical protein ABB37_04518 [Leptomonas pyrrhocoris]|uniref:Uncharacterized protein n=1 Tax=Leptomonas pyrrhocoris TaxID=157538 RepID=A0A0M9G2N6_LEPPY|nr:hypothetical protein ABB37_04518 [Leptomonas pyrrhocoris]KPA81180.1 hypothetical protein ABB37_04518 [Leptomonas pyrrhocoris]|eukprot:XP_015659619.1 hypothetical protein ABB37_04518 [Leptomonas pyrrhocoris]